MVVRRLVLFMHTSLDGFVAGPQGEMEWIKVDDEIFDFVGGRTNVADTALYGRRTFEMMQNYWPTAAEQPNATRHDIEHARWYNGVNKVVLSTTIKKAPRGTAIISDNVEKRINDLKNADGKEILMFGSPTAAHALMEHDLIDEYWLFVNPILLGKGIPLFKNVEKQTQLSLVKSHTFASGVVCLNYVRQ